MSGKEREYLPHSPGCLLCGDENECGVRTRFFVENGAVMARVSLPLHVNGYRDVAHGGILAALLDETMGWAATVFGKSKRMYITAELTVRYLAPVPVCKEIEIRSRLVRDSGRVAYSEGELACGGEVCVKASGKFIPMSREETGKVMQYLKFDRCREFSTLFAGAREER